MHSVFLLNKKHFFFFKHWIASELNLRSLAETIILQRLPAWPLGKKKTTKKRQLGEIDRFLLQSTVEEIACHLLYSWKIALEYSCFADSPSTVISIRTFGRLEVYWDNWNFKQAPQVCRFYHATDFKTESPICFKKDLH